MWYMIGAVLHRGTSSKNLLFFFFFLIFLRGGFLVVFFVCLIDGAFWPTDCNISSESLGGEGGLVFLINQIISVSKINIKTTW